MRISIYQKMKKILAMLLTLSMLLSLLPAAAFATPKAKASAATPAVKTGTATVTMLKENGNDESMCNRMFAEKADISVEDGQATLKMYVAFPVPAFPNDGKEGTVKNVVFNYGGQKYQAESDITTKPLKPAREDHTGFGFVKDQEIPMQVLTVTLPESAIYENNEIVTNAYVDVVMKEDVVFRTKLSNIHWNGESTTPEYELAGYCKIDLSSRSFEYNGKTYDPKELVKIPNMNSGYNANEQRQQLSNHDDLPLLKKDGKYYVQFRWQREFPGPSPAYDSVVPVEAYNKVNIDLDHPDASQTSTPVDVKVVKINGLDYNEVMFELGTKENMNKKQFYWTQFGQEVGGKPTDKHSYERFFVEFLPEFTINPNQTEKMWADGEYTADIKVVNGGHKQPTEQDLTVIPNEKAEISIKDGKATIRLKYQNPTSNDTYSQYRVSGSTSRTAPEIIEHPIYGTNTGYAYIQTDDLRKVIFLNRGDYNSSIYGKETDTYQYSQAVRINMDSKQNNPNKQPTNLVEDGNYTANIEILDEQNKPLNLPITCENVNVSAKSGLISVTAPCESTRLTDYTRQPYDKYVTKDGGLNSNNIRFILYDSQDIAHCKIKVDGQEKTFKVKFTQDGLKEIFTKPDLPDGNYTVDIDTLKEMMDVESMSGNFIEKNNVAVNVADGKMYMTLDIKTTDAASGMSNLIKGIKHKVNGKWREDTFVDTPTDKYNDNEKRITTTIQIDKIGQPTYVSVYVTAMGSWATLRVIPKASASDKPAVDAVVQKIDGIGTVTVESEQKINEARSAYDALTDLQKIFVKNVSELKTAENQLPTLKKLQAVKDKIDLIPSKDEITVEHESIIKDANDAYTTLTRPQKTKIPAEYKTKLTEAMAKIDALKKATPEDIAAAQAVTKKIELLPASDAVTLKDKASIEEARAEFNKLSNLQKQLVNKVDKLTAAETKLANLATAQAVVEKIDQLPAATDIKLSDEEAIVTARNAYDALTEAQKKLVAADKLQKLQAAEAKIVALKNPQPENPSETIPSEIALTMMHETKDQPSMCNPFFDRYAKVINNNNGTVNLQLLVAYPVPNFADQGADGTLKNAKIVYNGTEYPADSDINSKPNMTVKETAEQFGFVKDASIPAQVLTFKNLPKEAITDNTSGYLEVHTYVNVFMMTDVIFRAVMGVEDNTPITPEIKPGEEVQNEDGSITKTETLEDGTVVETTTGKPDGSTNEKTTKPDGTIIDKTTDKAGNIDEKTEKPDGTTIDKFVKTDGLTTETTTTKEGKVTAEVIVPEGQKNVKVTIPKKDLKPGEVAVITKADGTKEVIKKSVAGEDGLNLLLDENTKLEIVDNSKTFNDVKEENWANPAIDFVTSREIFNGTGDSTFAPDATMTRGMLVQVLYNFENRPEGAKAGDFGDVKDDAWYADAVAWAADNKIVAGVGDNNFAPEQEISREQLVTILYRYAGEPKPAGSLDKYSDASKVSSYAQDAMLWAVENGIVSGMGNNTLAPQGDATRAQVAQIMMNFCDFII